MTRLINFPRCRQKLSIYTRYCYTGNIVQGSAGAFYRLLNDLSDYSHQQYLRVLIISTMTPFSWSGLNNNTYNVNVIRMMNGVAFYAIRV